ncbi:MAG TPA: amidohydrolase family protein [Candidatus Krumholzibacteria bacterium]|nr:amidohydrolase family protein [Candidatus Krumholzibacteria bacterium]
MRTPLIVLLLLFVSSSAHAQLAVRGATVHTMAGDPIADGVVLIEDGRVVRVGPVSEIDVPSDYEVLEAEVVLPGLIDARSVVGLAGQFNVDADQDQLEASEAIQPELRAIDAFNIRERLVSWVRDLGVTTLHTGHGPGKVVSGRTMVVKTAGENADAAALATGVMVAATLGDGATESGRTVPGTRSKAVAILRQALIDAREHAEKDDPDRNLRLETLARVLDGEVPLMITAHRHQDILSALRLQREFGFRLVLDGASDAHLVLDEIAEAGVPVVVHPTMTRPGRPGSVSETENVTVTMPAQLAAANIPFAFQSGFESYVPKTRVVLFEAAMAVAYGLDEEVALRALTIVPASILGVDDRVGSLEPGKDADLALYDGDPFEYTTHCVGVVIDGEIVSRQAK